MAKINPVKDMMGGYVPNLQQAVRDYFPDASIAGKALEGDVEALKKVADLGYQGEFLKANAPRIAESLGNHIEGITEAQKAYQSIYSKAGKGGQTIYGGQKALSLQDLQYQHKRTEIEQRYNLGVTAANHQHGITQDMGLKYAALQYHLRESDQRYQQAVINATPQVLQIEANRKHRLELQSAALQYGSDMREDLIIRKNTTEGFFESVRDFGTRIKNFFVPS